MSDFELINKAAGRIYPTHLKEHEKGSSFSWSNVLPVDAKLRLGDSEGHKQTDDRNSHTLTHKLKGGASIEFNITQNGKNHIAMAKYHKGGKLFTAIHSHEDPSKAIKTAYDSVARRIVTEEAEIALIEKMEKRIEKKTGKLSDKKEKIDVEPSEEKELKESTPPGMESWVKKNKARFVKEYGEKKGHEVLYATAWKLHNKMNEMEELDEIAFQKGDHVVVNSGDGSPWTGRISRVGKGREGYAAPTTYAQLHSIKPDKEYQDRRGSKTVLVHPRNVELSESIQALNEDQLNELSKKTLASYVKKSNHSSFELGYDAASNEFHDDGDYKKTQKDEKKALKRQRFVSKAIDKLAEAEYPTDTKQGILAQLDYHHGRENYHRQSAEMNHRKANKFTLGSENYKLYKNVAKGQEAIANHHYNSIQDLHKKFATVNEAEQLDELSPHTLGRYIKFAAIDKSKHAAHGAISDMSMYNAQNRGDKKDAQREKERGDIHRKKEDKRTSGILKATDKLVRKAHGLHEASRPAPHPDKVVMTSSIRKDLGGGYMAKTRNGHFYKLDVNALGEPGKGRELPNLGTVLDTSKHKFIGKDKVDLNLLKEHIGNETDSLKNYIHAHPILGRFNGKEEKYYHKEDGDVRAFHEPNGKHVLVYSKKTTPYGATHKATIYYKRAENEPMLPQTRKFVGHEPDHVLHAVAHEFTPIKEDLDHDHPDMKAYHAACKARDVAHLASIRYRMSHDIKQPEHRAKYDELEAEHHRLRDIEDAAGEKVNGKLYGPTGLFTQHMAKK